MGTILYSNFTNFFSFSLITRSQRTFGALIGIDGKVIQFLKLLQSIAMLFVGPLLGIYVDKKGPLKSLRIGTFLSII